jgi:hypothetical protein
LESLARENIIPSIGSTSGSTTPTNINNNNNNLPLDNPSIINSESTTPVARGNPYGDYHDWGIFIIRQIKKYSLAHWSN